MSHLKGPCHRPRSTSKLRFQMPSSRVRAAICHSSHQTPQPEAMCRSPVSGELGLQLWSTWTGRSASTHSRPHQGVWSSELLMRVSPVEEGPGNLSSAEPCEVTASPQASSTSVTPRKNCFPVTLIPDSGHGHVTSD